MNRPVSLRAYCGAAGYTLVEMLVATALTLMLMGAVVAMFGRVSEGITDSRAMLEAADRLRLAETRLQMDLTGVTVSLSNPWCRPENNLGYFEYIEGPYFATMNNAVDSDSNTPDLTVGDYDDILMFTTRSTGRPFVGRFGTGTIQSDVAEVAWFVRGRTLYRRVLLVAPGVNVAGHSYADCDVSVRMQGGALVANTLGDLTKRENRYAHPSNFPCDVRGWGQYGLPTLRECSAGWVVGTSPTAPGALTPDFWSNDTAKRIGDPAINAGGPRIADDVILTNVIGFDVKAWDPAVGLSGVYVDLAGPNAVTFAKANWQPKSQLTEGVYDTWPTHYEYVDVPGLTTGTPGQAVNGFDDDVNGIVDDANELRTSPPYLFPLRGIRVKIRVFEPDSRQIREVTVVQDFLPQ